MANPKPHMVNGSRQYMSKAQRPCDFCRARKTACRIQAGPPCRMCVLHGRSCTFRDASVTQVPWPTGLARNGLETTETRSEPLMASDAPAIGHQSQPAGHHPASPSPIQSTETREEGDELPAWEDFAPNFSDFGIPTLSFANGDGLDISPVPHAELDGEPVEHQLPDTLLGSDNMESTPQFIGTTGEFEPHLFRHYSRDLNGRQRFKKLTLQFVQSGMVPSHFWFISQSLYSQGRDDLGVHRISDKLEERRKLEFIVPMSVGRRLIRLFDRFIAPHYPIFSSKSRPSPESSPIYLLAAIYSITNCYSQYDDSLTLDFAYQEDSCAELLRIAHRAIESELHGPTFPVIQALILMLVQPATGHLTSGSCLKRTLLGMLISAAHTMGLHTDPGSWPIAPWQIAQRRRVSFVIFTVDTWISCALGSPPLIVEQNWLIDTLSPEDVFESGLSLAHWTLLLHQSQLTSILRSILSKLHSLRAMANLTIDTDETFSIARQLQGELQTWRESVSHDIGNSSGPGGPGGPSTINLVGYYYCHINICRAILSSHVANERFAMPPASPNTDESRQYARNITKQCLVGAMQFFLHIEPEPEEAFWPVWAPMAFASFVNLMWLMLVTSNDCGEAMEWIKMLSKSRRDLRIKSKQLCVLRLALLRMDALFWKGISETFHLAKHVSEAVVQFYQESGDI